ncbi:MAG: hypothetical protein KatS3mg120_1631 [Erythrobacter sp.]|nr:MAG: hypothetical protein KatS3mg120_1631 [Erythrobacter sp.]
MRRGRQAAQDVGRKRAGWRALIAHRLFAAAIGVWGALLGGLAVMVLPASLVATHLAPFAPAALAPWVQPLAALIAAALLAGLLGALAAALSRRVRAGGRAVEAQAPEDCGPIHPARDLGLASLDEAFSPDPPAAEPHCAPQELDLAGFAALPGRNAVWVEEPAAPEPVAPEPVAPEPASQHAPEPAPEPAPVDAPAAPVAPLRRGPAIPDPGAAALARLRAVPLSELSLAEMVERLAGAIHEHRRAEAGTALTSEDLAARQAALAEALKALAALGGEDAAGAGDAEPLRAALARLQHLRGAA